MTGVRFMGPQDVGTLTHKGMMMAIEKRDAVVGVHGDLQRISARGKEEDECPVAAETTGWESSIEYRRQARHEACHTHWTDSNAGQRAGRDRCRDRRHSESSRCSRSRSRSRRVSNSDRDDYGGRRESRRHTNPDDKHRGRYGGDEKRYQDGNAERSVANGHEECRGLEEPGLWRDSYAGRRDH